MNALAEILVEAPEPDLTGTMLVVCCNCKANLGTKPCLQRFDGEVSHGLCPTCLQQSLDRLNHVEAAR